ncbi:MAG TPA: hypothetical protein VGK94_01440 [Candidatus Polarisedimenticolia bacterium]|jgi:hypothetical protein
MRSPLLAAILSVSFILAASIGLFFLVRGAGRIETVDCLPAETLLLVHVPDPPALARALARTRLVPPGPEGGEDLWNVAAELMTWVARSRGIEINVAADELKAPFGHETSFALVPGDELERPGLALITRAPAGARRSLPAVADFARERVHGFSSAWWSDRRYRGIDYRTLRSPGGSGPICFAVVGGNLVATTTGASMRRILDTATGRGDSLRSTTTYRDTLKTARPDSDLAVFAAGDWIRSLTTAAEGRRDPTALAEIFGLAAVRGAGLAIHVRKDLFQERLSVALAGNRQGLAPGLLASLRSLPRPDRLARHGFPFLVTFSAAGLDAMLGKLPGMLAESTGTSSLDLEARLTGIEEFLSIDLRRDLLAALGDEVTIGFGRLSALPRGGTGRWLLDTPALASIGLRDPDAAARFLRRTDGLARALASYRTMITDGRRITYYEMPSIAPLLPAYRMTEARLVVATSPELLAGAAGAGARGREESGRAGIDPTLEMLPEEATMFFGADSARLIDLVDPERAARVLDARLVELLVSPIRAASNRPDLPLTAAAARSGEARWQVEWVGPFSPAMLAALLLAGELQEGGGSSRADGVSVERENPD